MFGEGLTHDVENLPARIQAGIGILKNHLHAPSQRRRVGGFEGFGDGLPVKQNLACARGVQTHQQPRDSAFAATRFANQRQRFTAMNLKAHAVHRMHKLLGFAFDNAVQPGRRHIE